MRESNERLCLKLREDFFDSEPVVSLESMPDGLLYTNLLLKLCLKSLKHGGELRQADSTPCTPQTLADVTRQSVDTVERALKIFCRFGLVKRLPGSVWRMTGVADMTAELPYKYPQGHGAYPVERQMFGDPLGRFRNVLLTGQELASLREEFPSKADAYIERLSKYMYASGRQYPNHAATLRRWMMEDSARAVRSNTGVSMGYDHDYSVGEDETV